ncbi:MAG TPA: hypothetical protein VGE97_04875, partial [Nitrososphaera sp.]
DDNMLGGNGDDTMNGGPDVDFMNGEDGNDHLVGRQGNDNMFGGDDNDILDSRDRVVNNDKLDGGAGIKDVCFSDPDPEVNCDI